LPEVPSSHLEQQSFSEQTVTTHSTYNPPVVNQPKMLDWDFKHSEKLPRLKISCGQIKSIIIPAR
jgi:hypothetical protein